MNQGEYYNVATEDVLEYCKREKEGGLEPSELCKSFNTNNVKFPPKTGWANGELLDSAPFNPERPYQQHLRTQKQNFAYVPPKSQPTKKVTKSALPAIASGAPIASVASTASTFSASTKSIPQQLPSISDGTDVQFWIVFLASIVTLLAVIYLVRLVMEEFGSKKGHQPQKKPTSKVETQTFRRQSVTQRTERQNFTIK